MRYDPTDPPAAPDLAFDWEFESSAHPPIPLGNEDDYELDALLDDDALTRARRSIPAPALRDDIDLMLETWNGAWAEAVPRIGAAASTPDPSDGPRYDYDYELTLQLDAERPQSDHAVLFFDEEADRLREVSAFIADGLAAGERVCLALTQELRRSVTNVLPAGLVAEAERTEQLIILDARATLTLLAPHGTLDPSAFDELVATPIRGFDAHGTGLRVYGEMVTLLWAEGHVVAALELERLWNELQQEVAVFLLCAYPVSLVSEDSEGLAAIHECHSEARAL